MDHTLEAYFDEAGSEHDPRTKHHHMGMASLVAPAYVWRHFEPRWKAVLDEFGLQHFHMLHLAHSKGDYTGWPEGRRRALLAKLLDVIAYAKPRIHGAIVDLRAWHSISQDGFGFSITAWEMCMTMALREVIIYAEATDAKVRVIVSQFDQGERITKALLAGQDHSPALVGGDMLPMQSCYPLQAADLLAYEAVKSMETLEEGHRITPQRHPFKSLLTVDDNHHLLHLGEEQVGFLTDLMGLIGSVARGEVEVPPKLPE